MHMQLLRDIPCAGYISYIENFHIHSMHLDIIKAFFFHQLMHKRIVLKAILKFT